ALPPSESGIPRAPSVCGSVPRVRIREPPFSPPALFTPVCWRVAKSWCQQASGLPLRDPNKACWIISLKDLFSMAHYVFESLADSFRAEGIDTCFALLGDANMNWATALADK